jgi:hypothetical protein
VVDACSCIMYAFFIKHVLEMHTFDASQDCQRHVRWVTSPSPGWGNENRFIGCLGFLALVLKAPLARPQGTFESAVFLKSTLLSARSVRSGDARFCTYLGSTHSPLETFTHSLLINKSMHAPIQCKLYMKRMRVGGMSPL